MSETFSGLPNEDGYLVGHISFPKEKLFGDLQ